MFKKCFALFLCTVCGLSFAGCVADNQQSNTDDSSQNSSSADNDSSSSESDADKLDLTVTFNAMKEFAYAVGKDKVNISVIIPDSTSAHGFEPTAKDLAGMTSADIFIYNGLNMESWADDAIQAANNDSLIVVEASEGADLIVRDTDSDDEHDDEDADSDSHDDDEDADSDSHDDDEDEEESEHSHGKYDPHLWIGISGAKTEVDNILNAFVQADPQNKDFYEANAAEFISQLDALYDEYSEKFSNIESKTFVTGHAAFGYLCRDFGLTQNSVKDIYAEGEPSAQQLAQLVDYCRENNVTTIFAENSASAAVSQTLANEVNAKVETIYTMETAEDGMSYLERLEVNLKKIYESLSE